MAAPADKTVTSLSGKWGLNKELSSNPEPTLLVQGIGFLIRKAIGVASVTLDINQYDGQPIAPSTATEPVTFVAITQSASGLKGTEELRCLDKEIRDHSDWLFGSLKTQSRWVTLDDIEDEYLRSEWEEGTEKLILTHVKNHKDGWEATQVLGFQIINGERRYCARSLAVKGEKQATALLVYNYIPQ